jgi:hypothetical protein
MKQEAAIQQREQLKQVVLNRFIQDYAKRSQPNADLIAQEVNHYFSNNRVTEQGLRDLKRRVAEQCAGSQAVRTLRSGSRSQAVSRQGSVKGRETNLPQLPGAPDLPATERTGVRPPVVNAPAREPSVRSRSSKAPSLSQRDNKSVSSYASSSRAPRSVYLEQGDLDDEWATLVKFDTELFKKEQMLDKFKEAEYKKRQNLELGMQVQERKRKEQEEKDKEMKYIQTRE